MGAAEEGHDVSELMERAGCAVAEHLLARFPDARSFAFVCGGGANGGDGRIAARALREAGREAVETERPGGADVVVDALFGTGFRGTPRPGAARLIQAINEAEAPVVAVDIPSGVDASTGEVPGPAVSAELTITFHGPKVGHHVAPGLFHAGEVVVADIGLAPVETEHRLVAREVLSLVPLRAPRDNKYSAGSVVVVGGSPGMTGAVCLAAQAAFRADAGYVAVVSPRESLPVIEAWVLEAVKRPLEEVWEALERATALAVGPGLGRDHADLVGRLLRETDLPAVVDADALHDLEPRVGGAATVLTPHAGELGRLLDEASSWVAEHRLEAVQRAADRFGAVVLLKGADTLIGSPGQGVLVRPVDTSALATAGTGDVLTGVIASFLAKGMEPRLAAAAAATAHGLAASLVVHKAGLVASDVVRALPAALERG